MERQRKDLLREGNDPKWTKKGSQNRGMGTFEGKVGEFHPLTLRVRERKPKG